MAPPGEDEEPRPAMPLVDFQKYMDQQRRLREESDQKLYDARVDADERAQADNLIRRISPCDGATGSVVLGGWKVRKRV